MSRIQRRMQSDMDFLVKAFPDLQKQFPGAEWQVAWRQDDSFFLVLGGARITASISYSQPDGYRLFFGDAEIRTDTISQIVDFLGCVARAFAPVDLKADVVRLQAWIHRENEGEGERDE